jgi:ABC-type glycerol-3-phosphate transport system substrate-binding protein
VDQADFFASVWPSFQWDQGLWAIPVAVDPIIIVYQPDEFDAAGLSYPTDQWTIDDFEFAIRQLAEVGADGTVQNSGVFLFDFGVDMLFISLTGETLYDDAVIPSAPALVRPGIESLLIRWETLAEEGYVTPQLTGNLDDFPLRVVNSFGVFSLGQENVTPPQGALLPGGRAGLSVSAFAVSGGTAYPQEAYTFVKWLSRQPDVVERSFGTVPARRSLIGVQGDTETPFNLPEFTPEQQALFQRAVENGIPPSQSRFREYLTEARNSIIEDGVDPLVALQDAESLAVANLQAAQARREDAVVFVATPIPTPVPDSGQIALKFGLPINLSQLPNGDVWEQALDEFVANDAQVSQIIQDVRIGGVDAYTENSDCFFLQQNVVPSVNLQSLLNLDPYLDADPTFDRADVLPGVLPQVQRENLTWAYPIMIQPQILRYDHSQFVQRGVVPPETGWTIDQFNDALVTLRPTPDDLPPLVPRGFGGDYLLILTAAYGGLPLDYRTDPPTVNFTDPANVDAIRQVLDLAKNGYIDYQELSNFGPTFAFGGEELQDLIYTELAGPFSLGNLLGNDSDDDDPYRAVTYPTGNQFNAAVYEIGGLYISANTQSADACYRLVSWLASRPDLASAMPARFSLLNDPNLVAAQGQDVVNFYNQMANLMAQPSTIHLPSQFGGGSPEGLLLPLWLNRAFDAYVLEDGDLQQNLEDMQAIVTGYLDCSAGIPAFDPATFEDQDDYFREFANCALLVDPSLQVLFDAILGED